MNYKLKTFFLIVFLFFFYCDDKIRIDIDEGSILYFYIPSIYGETIDLSNNDKNFYIDDIKIIKKLISKLNFKKKNWDLTGNFYFVQLVKKNKLKLSMVYLMDSQSFAYDYGLSYFNIYSTNWFVNSIKKTKKYKVQIWGLENSRELYRQLTKLGAFILVSVLDNGENSLFYFNYEAELYTHANKKNNIYEFKEKCRTELEKDKSIIVSDIFFDNLDTLKFSILSHKDNIQKIPHAYKILTKFREIEIVGYEVMGINRNKIEDVIKKIGITKYEIK